MPIILLYSRLVDRNCRLSKNRLFYIEQLKMARPTPYLCSLKCVYKNALISTLLLLQFSFCSQRVAHTKLPHYPYMLISEKWELQCCSRTEAKSEARPVTVRKLNLG